MCGYWSDGPTEIGKPIKVVRGQEQKEVLEDDDEEGAASGGGLGTLFTVGELRAEPIRAASFTRPAGSWASEG